MDCYLPQKHGRVCIVKKQSVKAGLNASLRTREHMTGIAELSISASLQYK